MKKGSRMSARYEMNDADVDLDIVGPGSELGEYEVPLGRHMLVVGDPWASAYAIEGSVDELQEFARRVAALVAHLAPIDHHE
jgi:hypothetical protein